MSFIGKVMSSITIFAIMRFLLTKFSCVKKGFGFFMMMLIFCWFLGLLFDIVLTVMKKRHIVINDST